MILNSFLNYSKAFVKPTSFLAPLSLTTLPQQSIVYRYVPKRSPFDKTNYIDNYIPPPLKYHKKRKPRLAEWEDPNVHWPPIMPEPTKLQGKQLLNSLLHEEVQNMKRLRLFHVPDIRTGDVIEIKYLFSLSEQLGNILQGVVTSRRKKQSYDSSFTIVTMIAGSKVIMDFKEMSPLLVDMKLIHKGSGNLRSKLNYLKEIDVSKGQYMRPVLKRGMKKRRDEAGFSTKKKKINFNPMKLDRSTDPLLD